MARLHEWLSCTSDDGEPLPRRKCKHYRRVFAGAVVTDRGPLPAVMPAPGGVGTVHRMRLPALLLGDGASVGLGDSVAKLLIATRLKKPAIRFIKWWFKTTDCGCRARQAAWNERWPWPEWWRNSVGNWLRRWI